MTPPRGRRSTGKFRKLDSASIWRGQNGLSLQNAQLLTSPEGDFRTQGSDMENLGTGVEDIEMRDTEVAKKMIVAIDFGTTFSSVAYAMVPITGGPIELGLNDVHCVQNYPGDRIISTGNYRNDPRQDVPTELWYTVKPSPRRGRPARRVNGFQSPLPDNAADNDSDSSSGLTSLSDDEPSVPMSSQNLNAPSANSTDSPYWGFRVQERLHTTDIPKDRVGYVTRFKLMLDAENPSTEQVRKDLSKTLRALRRSKQIKQDTDIITHYLSQLFMHAKSELLQVPNFSFQTPIEFVLCVPAVWPAKACRIMQSAMVAAAQESELQSSTASSLENLFIVSEPEAAAACVLEENQDRINPGARVVILDAGGGTVDAITYQVMNSHPLRLSKELVTADNKLCGSSYINERFEELLVDKLKDETYLENNGKSITSIVQAEAIKFENGQKRTLDVYSKMGGEMLPLHIHYLQENLAKGFKANRLYLTKSEVRRLFKDSLKGTFEVLKRQFEKAKSKQISIEKVILIGGFGQSPSLQSYLRSHIARERNYDGEVIDFLVPGIISQDIARGTSTAVARGAILRACNKEMGPERKAMSSYGFLQDEPYEPESYPEHRTTVCVIDKADGERYVNNTIYWLIDKGETIEPRREITLKKKHTFKPSEVKFICREELYVSDNVHESHYRKGHFKNKGAELEGSIEVNMSFLRDENLIQLEQPSEDSVYAENGVPHWAVEFDLVMVIDGRNMSYEARWPPSHKLSQFSQNQEVMKRGQINIAAAFMPGTN